MKKHHRGEHKRNQNTTSKSTKQKYLIGTQFIWVVYWYQLVPVGKLGYLNICQINFIFPEKVHELLEVLFSRSIMAAMWPDSLD